MNVSTDPWEAVFPGVESVAAPRPRPEIGGEASVRDRLVTWAKRLALGAIAGLGLLAFLLAAVWALDDLGGRNWTTAEAANVYVARRVVVDELLVQGDPAVAAELVATDAAIRSPDGVRSGPAGLTAFVDRLHAAVPDASWAVRAISPDGDRVRIGTMLTGTFRRPFLGQAQVAEYTALPVMIDLRIVEGLVHEVELFVTGEPGGIG